jgi:tellurite resistance protein TerC
VPNPTPTHSPDAKAPPPIKARDIVVALLCVVAGLAFGLVVWLERGPDQAQQYLAGYLIELSLSVDNVFVFALVFAQFALGPARQRKLLFWGICGAIVFRTVFLLAGISAINRFTWIIPVFGAFILATGIRLLVSHGRKGFDPSGGLFKLVTRLVPAALAALVVLETTDLIFALDSLPAVLAVTHVASIAIASNLFAILGLRSLYFVISGLMGRLRYLNLGLAAVLSFVGIKMLAEPWYKMPTPASLVAITLILAVSVAASVLRPPAPARK